LFILEHPYYILPVLVFYLIFRWAYWFFFERGADFTADGYVTLLAGRAYRKNGFKRIAQMPNMVRPFPFVYPSFGIYLISFLPEKLVIKWGGLMNTFFDLIWLKILLLTVLLLGGGMIGMCFAGLVFIFLPTIYGRNSTNGMHFSLTWRDFGRLGASFFFLGAFFFEYKTMHSSYAILIAACTFLSFLICYYGSQFAMQSVIFGSLFFSLFTWSWFCIAMMLFGHLFVLLVDGKHMIRYYAFKFKHFRTYFVNLRHTHDSVTGDFAFSFKHIRIVLSHLLHFQFAYARSVSSRDPFLRGIYLFPIQFVFIIAMWYCHNSVSFLLLGWYAASVTVWLLTLTPVLKIFGEPDRYLEFFGYLPVLIGMAYSFGFLFHYHLWVWILALAALCWQLIFFRTEMKTLFSKSKKRKKERIDLTAIINELREKGSFLKGENVLPLHFSHAWKIAYLFDCNLLYPPLDDENETAFISSYPYPNKENFNEICRKYQIGYIISDTHIDKTNYHEQVNSIVSEEHEIGKYFVYKVNKLF
jgi:hypothetical protein